LDAFRKFLERKSPGSHSKRIRNDFGSRSNLRGTLRERLCCRQRLRDLIDPVDDVESLAALPLFLRDARPGEHSPFRHTFCYLQLSHSGQVEQVSPQQEKRQRQPPCPGGDRNCSSRSRHSAWLPCLQLPTCSDSSDGHPRSAAIEANDLRALAFLLKTACTVAVRTLRTKGSGGDSTSVKIPATCDPSGPDTGWPPGPIAQPRWSIHRALPGSVAGHPGR